MDPVIVTKNLSKLYKTGHSRIHALDDMNLSIDPGEFIAIVGTSGSGKSTLLHMLAGLDRPTSGKALVMGSPIHRMTEQQLVDFRLCNVGFIFQAFHLMPTLNAVENTAFALSCRGVSRRKREKKAIDLLIRLGLEEHLEHKPHELSGGQQQRVSIARALVKEPSIIFADEPTGNLDSKTSTEVMDTLQEVSHASGATVILVTHDMEKASYANRQIRISDGRIVEDIKHEA